MFVHILMYIYSHVYAFVWWVLYKYVCSVKYMLYTNSLYISPQVVYPYDTNTIHTLGYGSMQPRIWWTHHYVHEVTRMRITTYGTPTMNQRIRNLFIPKVWYKVGIPLPTNTHEEEQ